MLQKLYKFWGLKSEGWRRIILIGYPLFYIVSLYSEMVRDILIDLIKFLFSIWDDLYRYWYDDWYLILGISLIVYVLSVKTIIWIYDGFTKKKIISEKPKDKDFNYLMWLSEKTDWFSKGIGAETLKSWERERKDKEDKEEKYKIREEKIKMDIKKRYGQ